MRYPFLNARKPPGRRGEAMVSRMRSRMFNGNRRRSRAVPSMLHVSQTGTVSGKNFAGQRTGLPVIPAPIRGGFRGVSFREG